MMHDIVIIGAGPAGMTAAIYGRRASKTVLMIEAKSYGGQIINTPQIENYPAAPNISGYDFAVNAFGQASGLGAETVFEKALGITAHDGVFTVTTDRGEHEARSVIIATGSENRKLGLPDEDRLI
ncbi:MAG: FAD-dependent oxidoreductase, partial [Clostridia bacterium]|nr:FAD-dependent oxidoreductase [Clostridia bacterium]